MAEVKLTPWILFSEALAMLMRTFFHRAYCERLLLDRLAAGTPWRCDRGVGYHDTRQPPPPGIGDRAVFADYEKWAPGMFRVNWEENWVRWGGRYGMQYLRVEVLRADVLALLPTSVQREILLEALAAQQHAETESTKVPSNKAWAYNLVQEWMLKGEVPATKIDLARKLHARMSDAVARGEAKSVLKIETINARLSADWKLWPPKKASIAS